MRARPAETAGSAVGLAGVIYGIADHNWTAAVVALAGVVPAGVTYLVTHGGVRGVLSGLWRGRKA